MRRIKSKIYHYVKKLPFPITLSEIRATVSSPKILVNSMPKSGTNLLIRVVSMFPHLLHRWKYHVDNQTPDLPQKISQICRGQYLSGHLYWSQELSDTVKIRDIRPLFIMRDLRDISVSNAYYITHINPNHRLHGYFNSLPSDFERLMASIKGISAEFLPDGVRSKSIGEHAISYMPWLKEPSCLTIRFEDLIGESGGGSYERQVNTVCAIAEHLGIPLAAEKVVQIAEQAFSHKSPTFRRGQIGDWQNHFQEKHKQIFKEVAGEALIKLGYVSGHDW